MSESFVGRTFGRYRLVERIGAGGMGEVYRGHDERLDRDVAIKVIRSGVAVDDEARRRLRREADTLSKLNHPNIATIYDFDSHDDVDFVVMELVAGETLDARVQEGGVDEQELLRIGIQIASGLEDAHERGVIHRDLKPGNVMLTPKGQVKLLDFGLAQRTMPVDITRADTVTAVGKLTGTFPYMAPEQLRNQAVGPWTDVWALGVLLYELATGVRPFGGTDIASIVDGVMNRAPDPPSRLNRLLSPGLDEIILTALSKSPADRYQTAAAAGAALRALQTGSASHSVSRSFSRTTAIVPPLPRRLPVRWIAIAALVLAAAGVLTPMSRRWWTSSSRPPSPSATPNQRLPVLVGGVDNRTGDPTFDQMLPELLTTTLEQSHAISVYPSSNLGYVLRRMQRDPVTPIDESIGREICQREGLGAVVLQSITRLGGSFVLVVRAVLPDGRVMASTQQALAQPSDLPDRMDAIGKALRGSFGESAASIAQASAPLAEVTSRSLDAVRFYTLGRQRIYAGDPRGALVFMQKAVDIDPDFAMAHAGLGVAYTNVFDMVRAEQHLREAAARVSRAPEIEREKILGDFNMIRRNYDAACPHFEVLTALRPRDPAAFLSLGYCAAMRLDFTTGLAATRKAYEMQPTVRTRINLALVTFLSGDAQQAFELADAVRREAPGLAQGGFVSAKARFALGRTAEARGIYEGMVAAGGDAEIEGHAGLADLARAAGDLAAARRELEAQRTAARQRDNQFAATTASAALAEVALAQGSRARFQAALADTAAPSDLLSIYRVGRAWARGGDAVRAGAMLKQLDISYGPSGGAPERSPQRDAVRAMLRAEMSLAAGKPADAVKDAEAAVGFEASTTALDTLARAYVAARRDADAIRPYEAILSRRTERCESYDAPACYRLTEIDRELKRIKIRSASGR